MPPITDSTWALIQQVVASLLAVALTVMAVTWSKSPVHLPLPNSPHKRWLLVIPVLATAVMIGVLSKFTDCIYINRLLALALISLFACAALLVTQYHLFRRIPDASTLLVVVCLGWSILGTLSISSLAAMLIAQRQMDEVHRTNPLTLWQLVGDEKREPPAVIYLAARLPALFAASMDECYDRSPDWALSPDIGRLKTGAYTGTYFAPDKIEHEEAVTITVTSKYYHDSKSAIIRLVPDPADIKRIQYTGEDDDKREALFDFIIISKNDSWVIRSDDLVKKNLSGPNEKRPNAAPPTHVCRPILSLAKSRAFDPYVDIISIGTASREGGQTEEENRADRRSQKIAEWVNLGLRNAGRKKHVYKMNLGQYVPQPRERNAARTEDATAQERPVVIIGVVRAGEIDIEEALRNVFEQHQQEDDFLRFLASHYPGRRLELFDALPDLKNLSPDNPCLTQ